ncbi:alpha-ketoglutarate-dependent dioxygenase AlkB family protein [Pseudoalteromonas sp. T1lg65]|uniref:alpha-ketoglutarate-dependent dioxygenase AlkB family protein n=1 Tax=Pseudoalteromonas sp. T1lg65 TaxID=2077101 RepID=UPI003F7AB3C0
MRAQGNARNLPVGFSFQADAISYDKSIALYEHLKTELGWQSNTITVFGKTHVIPRLEYFTADQNVAYSYSGKALVPRPWPAALMGIRARISERYGCHFNAALINYYRNGEDCMGWHSDDEPELGPAPLIVSLSLGATRRFKIRHKLTKQVTDLDLTTGSMLVMSGQSQQLYQHSVPRQKKVHQGRINITFRSVGKPLR